jgi:hypothetical protein
MLRPAAVTHAFPLAALALVLAACNSSTAPDGNEGSLEDALARLNEVESLASPGTTMMGGMVAPSSGTNPCPYNASNHRFECSPTSHGGLTVSRYYVLLDGGGNPLSQWGSDVAAIRNVTDLSGTVTSIGTMHVTAHDESTLSGLGTSRHTLTGTGTATTTVELESTSITSTTTRTTSIVLPDRQSSNVYPTGTITMTSRVVGQAPATTMTMTYNGTSIVTMVMSLAGGTTITCTHDLSAPGSLPDCN